MVAKRWRVKGLLNLALAPITGGLRRVLAPRLPSRPVETAVLPVHACGSMNGRVLLNVLTRGGAAFEAT